MNKAAYSRPSSKTVKKKGQCKRWTSHTKTHVTPLKELQSSTAEREETVHTAAALKYSHRTQRRHCG